MHLKIKACFLKGFIINFFPPAPRFCRHSSLSSVPMSATVCSNFPIVADCFIQVQVIAGAGQKVGRWSQTSYLCNQFIKCCSPVSSSSSQVSEVEVYIFNHSVMAFDLLATSCNR